MTTVEEADRLPPEEPAPASSSPGQTVPDSPGARLRQAREARKLEVSEVATSLRLTPQAVEALERDDYRRLPSAVFIAGYIRSYARLLGLDPEPLNLSFRSQHPDVAPPPPTSTTQVERTDDDHSGGGLAVYLIAFLIVLALAAGGYGWSISRPETGPDQSAPDAASTQPGASAPRSAPAASAPSLGAGAQDRMTPASEIESDRSPDLDAGSETAASAPMSEAPEDTAAPVQLASPDVRVAEAGAQGRFAASEQSGDTEPAAASEPISGSASSAIQDGSLRDPSEPMSARSPLPSPASPEDERPLVRQASADPSGETAAPETESDGDAAAESDADAEQSDAQGVELAFTGPCWVDIRDSTGEVLLFGEMGRGSREQLGGTPPYSLVLGNAAAVELTVAGQPYDLDAVARGNVARFQLDPSQIETQDSAQGLDAADETSD